MSSFEMDKFVKKLSVDIEKHYDYVGSGILKFIWAQRCYCHELVEIILFMKDKDEYPVAVIETLSYINSGILCYMLVYFDNDYLIETIKKVQDFKEIPQRIGLMSFIHKNISMSIITDFFIYDMLDKGVYPSTILPDWFSNRELRERILSEYKKEMVLRQLGEE